MKVLLDTNALMMPAQFALDLCDELRQLVGAFEPIVLSGSVRELEGLSARAGKHGAAARYGRDLARRCTVVSPEGSPRGSVDADVIDWAERTGGLVVTNDRRLRDALLARGIGVISLRKQKRLELVRS